jgi:hypothetical protein
MLVGYRQGGKVMKFVNSASCPSIRTSEESVLQPKFQARLGYAAPHEEWKEALQARACYLRKGMRRILPGPAKHFARQALNKLNAVKE